jgi:hypothetical protein
MFFLQPAGGRTVAAGRARLGPLKGGQVIQIGNTDTFAGGQPFQHGAPRCLSGRIALPDAQQIRGV